MTGAFSGLPRGHSGEHVFQNLPQRKRVLKVDAYRAHRWDELERHPVSPQRWRSGEVELPSPPPQAGYKAEATAVRANTEPFQQLWMGSVGIRDFEEKMGGACSGRRSAFQPSPPRHDRPLDPKAIRYAVEGVAHLPALRPQLLPTRGRFFEPTAL